MSTPVQRSVFNEKKFFSSYKLQYAKKLNEVTNGLTHVHELRDEFNELSVGVRKNFFYSLKFSSTNDSIF